MTIDWTNTVMHYKRIQWSIDIRAKFTAKRGNQIRRTLSLTALSNVRQSQTPSQQLYCCNQQRSERLYLQKGRVYHRRWLSSVDSVASTQRNEQTTGIATDTKRSQFVMVSVNVQNKLHASIKRYNEIMEEMKSGKIISHGMQQEMSSLGEAYKLYQQHTLLHDDEQSYIDLIEELQLQQQQQQHSTAQNTTEVTEENQEILEDCQKEIRRIYNEKLQCEEKLVDAILPKDMEDITYDAIIEIRAGTGGDEASLFAREIWDCYIKCIKTIHKQWKVDILTETLTDLGGLKDGSFLITGNCISIQFDSPNMAMNEASSDDDTNHGTINTNSNTGDESRNQTITEEIGPYGFFKFESGVHRVQRIPVNAARIHTSACAIAVLPSMKDDTVDKNELLPMSELKIETMRAHGAGGQHINTTDHTYTHGDTSRHSRRTITT